MSFRICPGARLAFATWETSVHRTHKDCSHVGSHFFLCLSGTGDTTGIPDLLLTKGLLDCLEMLTPLCASGWGSNVLELLLAQVSQLEHLCDLPQGNVNVLLAVLDAVEPTVTAEIEESGLGPKTWTRTFVGFLNHIEAHHGRDEG